LFRRRGPVEDENLANLLHRARAGRLDELRKHRGARVPVCATRTHLDQLVCGKRALDLAQHLRR
jgi:hypothetical protein